MNGRERPVFLLLGVSSFTGSWFAVQLAQHGFDVRAVLTRLKSDYTGEQRARLDKVGQQVTWIEAAPLGSQTLLNVISELPSVAGVGWHHALVGDYRSPDFPMAQAIESCTRGLPQVADLLSRRGCLFSINSRSVFESDLGLPANGPPIGRYAIAKRAVAETVAMEMSARGIACADFVICNPVGQFEAPRLTAYLVREWSAGRPAVLRAPQWVRDNIPVPLLAESYAQMADLALSGPCASRNPSYWKMTNRRWVELVASEFTSRLPMRAEIAEAPEFDFSEPSERVGGEPIERPSWWRESVFWDRYAAYCWNHFRQQASCTVTP